MNIGGCDNANKKVVFEIPEGEKLECPHCHKTMLVEVKGNSLNWKMILSIVVVVIGGIGGVAYFLTSSKGPSIESLILNKSSIQLQVDDTDTLTITNIDIPAKDLIWKSTNESIATVNNGVVTMVGEGNASITVYLQYDPSIAATCTYTVEKRAPHVESSINVETMTFVETEEDMLLNPTEEKQLNIECVPQNADEMIIWKSSDEKIATVSPTGMVTAITIGKTTITAETNRSHTKTSIEVKVEMTPNSNDPTFINLGYATYEGPQKNGKPHGIGGKLTFKTKHTIDLKKVPAAYLDVQPGEYMENVKFDNGRLIQGELHRKDGTRKWIHI